jgi:PTS system beta-glucosides-specific IIC component
MAASMFKMLVAVLGPSMLNLINEGSDIYTLFTFVGDAGFYFLPIVIGYTAAKKFKATPVIGMFLGAILLHPTFVGLAATEGATFTVYGIPVRLANYASTIIPAILAVWILSHVERFFKKILPDSLKIVFVPFLSVLVMLPITLAVVGPAGAFIGDYISQGLLGLSSYGGIFTVIVMVLIAALFEFLVVSGMHLVLFYALVQTFTTQGTESLVMPAMIAASMSVAGMSLGAAFRIKDKKERNLSLSYFVASIIGGVTEPALYGLGFRFKRPFIGMVIGAAAGGLYYGITKTGIYTLVASANFLSLTSFVGGPVSNLVNGIVGGVIALVVAAVATYLLGFKKDDPLLQKAAE